MVRRRSTSRANAQTVAQHQQWRNFQELAMQNCTTKQWFSISGCWLQLFGRTQRRVSPVPESVASRFQHRWCWSQLFSTDATQSNTGASIHSSRFQHRWCWLQYFSADAAPRLVGASTLVVGSNIKGASCSILWWSVLVHGPRRSSPVAASWSPASQLPATMIAVCGSRR